MKSEKSLPYAYAGAVRTAMLDDPNFRSLNALTHAGAVRTAVFAFRLKAEYS